MGDRTAPGAHATHLARIEVVKSNDRVEADALLLDAWSDTVVAAVVALVI